MKLGYVGWTDDHAIARRLLASVDNLTAWHAGEEITGALQADGAQIAGTAADLVASCDLIFADLPAGVDLVRLALDPDGLGAELETGKIIIVLGDRDPGGVSSLAKRLEAQDISIIGACWRIAAVGPKAGEPMLLVSGAPQALETAWPTLTAMCPNIIRCGKRPGDAQALAVIDQMMTVSSGFGTLEAVAAGRKMGLSLKSMIDVLEKGSGRNYAAMTILPAHLQGGTALDVSLERMTGAIDCAISLGEQHGAPMFIASVARALLQAASNELGKQAPFDAIATAIERRAGTILLEPNRPPSSIERTNVGQAASGLTVGYVGLGAMGAPLARRLMQSFKTHVFDVRSEVASVLAQEGAIAAADLSSLARDCDVILLCLPTSKIVRQVLFGEGGLVEGLAPGKIVIDQTTGDPSDAGRIASELETLGVLFVDAPVTGGPETAQAGTATMICGGTEAAFDQVSSILKSIGPNVIYCGPSGSGHAAKLMNNASNISNRLISYEAAMLGFKYGLALDVMDEVINKSTGWSFASQRTFKAVATHAQTATISLELSLKDIRSGVEMGVGCGVPMTIADTVRNLFQLGIQQFGKDANVDEMARLFEHLGGIEFTGP